MSQTELHELLAKARSALPGSPPGDLAGLVTQWALTGADPYAAVYPAVLAWVQGEERSRVRASERAAFTGARGEAYVNPAQEAMARLLRTTVYVPGEGMVRWGDLTTGLHERRVRYLESTLRQFTEGIRDTISRHQRAVTVLEESGYATLAAYAAAEGDLPVSPPDP